MWLMSQVGRHWGEGELKFDGKMESVVYMIYKVAYIIEFEKEGP